MYKCTIFFIGIMLSTSIILSIFNVYLNKPCQYGPLSNGCVTWGKQSNGSNILGSTSVSNNGYSCISLFSTIMNTFTNTDYICFMPSPNQSLIVKSYTYDWVLYLSIGLQSATIFTLIVDGIHQCCYEEM